MTVQRARERAQSNRSLAPERTCFRCDGVFRVASDDRRVYCPACRAAFGFLAPAPADFSPGAQLALFPDSPGSPAGCSEVRSA